MVFSKARLQLLDDFSIFMSDGKSIEREPTYTYLGIWIRQTFFFFLKLRFITNTKSLTHHYILYDLVGWTALAIRRKQHWYIFIYKSNAR